MSEEEIEKLAFKNRKTLANLNEIDLLEIIEFLQLDRKQWINQYTKTHNDYVDLQQENQQLRAMLEIGKTCALCPYFKAKEQLQQRDEVIDEAIKHIQSLSSKGRDCMIYADVKKDILDILKKYKKEGIKNDINNI